MRTRIRKSLTRSVLLLGTLGAGASGQLIGCSSAPNPGDIGGTAPGVGTPSEDTGTVGMQLTLPNGSQLSTINWTITGPNGASTVVQSGSVNVANSQSIAFLVGGIPSGSNYKISLSGTATDGSLTCSGSATFSVTAKKTTNVSVVLSCASPAPDSGSVAVSGSTVNCGTVTSVSASPTEVILGAPVALSATATGPNPSALTYSWSASSGSFDNPSSANPNFTCSAGGTVTLTLTVGDGALPAGAVCDPTLNTSTVQVQCDATALQNDIQNIVFIYAENRTFDSLFGNYPGANGLSTVVDATGHPTAAYVPQKDRDGVTVLSKLPQTWGGATAAGNPTVVTQAQTDNVPNAPFPVETTFSTINGAPVLTTTDVTRDIAHRFFENQMEINGGSNDMFAAWEDAGGLTMGHFDYSKSALYKLAQQNVVADNFFEGAFGGSFLNHQYLICGCAPTVPTSFIMTNKPSVNVLGAPNAKGVPQLLPTASSPVSALTGAPVFQTGNIAPLDWFGAGDGYRAVNTMQPPFQPSGNFPAVGAADPRYADPLAGNTLPAQTQVNVGDLLSARNISWAWYATSWTAAVADGTQPAGSTHSVIYTPSTPRGNPDFQAHHHPFNYFAAFDPATQGANRAAHLKDYNDLVSAAGAGTLPAVAFYKPTGYVNQHPGYANLDDGDAHIAGLVTALQASPQYAHMVIVITYDEYGGQYDHVAPPHGDKIGPGTRIPAIIISPYAKAGTVDHTQYDTASILRLITNRFALPLLPGLAARDAALVAGGAPPMGDLTQALSLP
jgi:acid phosphatase